MWQTGKLTDRQSDQFAMSFGSNYWHVYLGLHMERQLQLQGVTTEHKTYELWHEIMTHLHHHTPEPLISYIYETRCWIIHSVLCVCGMVKELN